MAHLLDDFDRIAAFQVSIWSIYLVGAVLLCTRHDFTRSSGWVYLVILAVARIISASLRLATISDPGNTDLYIGWGVCSGIGLALLISINTGLMGRLLKSVRRANGGHALVTPLMQRLAKLVMLTAIVLFIVGGTQADWNITPDGRPEVEYPVLSKVAVSIMVAMLVVSILKAVYLATVRRLIPKGERRVLLAVFLTLPFATVRLSYSACIVYGAYTPSAWFSLGLEVMMEIIAAAIFEVIGFTLAKETPHDEPVQLRDTSDPERQVQEGKESSSSNTLLR
ncbi:hypothetical protein NLU13_6046 [Sarocladium strictum]|uniref:DUF7702 domain-containing protein n=1 Tax=Sarocladium strictum TaxID=5046 RepID=A0AA39L719_SARSR|nr:hypothetical protein NLU13_6046 [Sarocladium strictum]